MSNDRWPFPDPRVAGLKEHYKRIQTFLEMADNTKDPIVSFRLHVACIYFARAIIELIFEAAYKEQISSSREKLRKILPKKLRWYNLIERIRIHDFHRFGIIPPNPDMKVLFQGGPITLKAKKGTATYKIPSSGPTIETTGESSVKEERPLINNDSRFFDEDTKTYVRLDELLKDFLQDVPKVIEEFEQQIN